MFGSYLIGIVGIVSLMIIWVVVQTIWRNIFSDHISDEDVLAGRSSCANCGCTTVCENKRKKLSTE